MRRRANREARLTINREERHAHTSDLREWISTLCLVLILGGGAGDCAANTIGSDDVIDDSLLSADLKDNQVTSADVRNQRVSGGGLVGVDIQDSSLSGSDIAPESLRGNDVLDGTIHSSEVNDGDLTGDDVANQSGVDTCTHGSVRFGELCFKDPDEEVSWRKALDVCANMEMRLPSFGEALSLVENYDLPPVAAAFFWTEESFTMPNSDGTTDFYAWVSPPVAPLRASPIRTPPAGAPSA